MEARGARHGCEGARHGCKSRLQGVQDIGTRGVRNERHGCKGCEGCKTKVTRYGCKGYNFVQNMGMRGARGVRHGYKGCKTWVQYMATRCQKGWWEDAKGEKGVKPGEKGAEAQSHGVNGLLRCKGPSEAFHDPRPSAAWSVPRHLGKNLGLRCTPGVDRQLWKQYLSHPLDVGVKISQVLEKVVITAQGCLNAWKSFRWMVVLNDAQSYREAFLKKGEDFAGRPDKHFPVLLGIQNPRHPMQGKFANFNI